MITYVVTTSLGIVLFDESFNSIPIDGPLDVPPFTVRVDETHLFSSDDIESHVLSGSMDEEYIQTVKRKLATRMVDNASEILLSAEKYRMTLSSYSEIKQAFPAINKAVVSTLKKISGG